MSRFADDNLIRLFDFYLAAMTLLSFARRYTVYWDAVRVTVALLLRRPNLVAKLRQHGGTLVTAAVLRPLGVAVGLTAVQMICSRVIWPHAQLAVSDVTAAWWRAAVVLVAMVPMTSVDVYFLVRVGRFDRAETEKYLDQAEHWLKTWKTPLIQVVTLGYVNPGRIVDAEVKKSLTELGRTVGWVAWWASVQVGCRVLFGLTIWLLWALGGG